MLQRTDHSVVAVLALQRAALAVEGAFAFAIRVVGPGDGDAAVAELVVGLDELVVGLGFEQRLERGRLGDLALRLGLALALSLDAAGVVLVHMPQTRRQDETTDVPQHARAVLTTRSARAAQAQRG